MSEENETNTDEIVVEKVRVPMEVVTDENGVRWGLKSRLKKNGEPVNWRIRLCTHGGKCKYPAKGDTDKCHGHRRRTGPENNLYKHGRYSKSFSGTILSRYESYLKNGRGRENLEAQALLQAMIDDDAEKLQCNALLWSEAKQAFKDLKAALFLKQDETEELNHFQFRQSNLLKIAINDLEIALLSGGTDSDARIELRKNVDLQTKIKERQMRENVMTHGMIKLDELIVLLGRNREIIRDFIPAEKMNEFEKRFEKEMQLGSSNLLNFSERKAS